MNTLIDLATDFVSFDRVVLRWKFPQQVMFPVQFELWRSENATTGYQKIATLDDVTYIDKVALHAKFKPMYYRVTATVMGTTYESGVASLMNTPDETVLALQRRERFLLAKEAGVPAYLYTRRRTGKKCPRCTPENPSMGEAGVNCTLCFGVGIEGGFYPPLPIYLSKQTLTSKGANLMEGRVNEVNSSNLWTSNWSIISPEDVVREMVPPNTIWVVTGAQHSDRLRAPVRQLLTANESDKGSPLYRLPLPDFTFPARADIFLFDHEGEDDFDSLFGRLIDAYLEHDRRPYAANEVPTELPPPPEKPKGKKDRRSGAFY